MMLISKLCWIMSTLYSLGASVTHTSTAVTEFELSEWNLGEVLDGHHNVTALRYLGYNSRHPQDDMVIIEDFNTRLELHFHINVRFNESLIEEAPNPTLEGKAKVPQQSAYVYKIFAKRVGEDYSTKGMTVYMSPYGTRKGIKLKSNGFKDSFKKDAPKVYFTLMKGKEVEVGLLLARALKQQALLSRTKPDNELATVQEWINNIQPELVKHPDMKRVSGRTRNGNEFVTFVIKWTPKKDKELEMSEMAVQDLQEQEQLYLLPNNQKYVGAKDPESEVTMAGSPLSAVVREMTTETAKARPTSPKPWLALFKPKHPTLSDKASKVYLESSEEPPVRMAQAF